MKTIEVQLREILDSDGGQRAIHKFLKDHNELIAMSFNRAWNFYTCVSEFQMGSEYRADFLILSAHSVHWHAIFIELKDYQVSLYNKDGTPTKPLRKAQKQINDWREWVRVNQQYLRQRFSQILEKDEAPAIWPHSIQNNQQGYSSGASEIGDVNNIVENYFHIVIGRSSSLTPEERKRRSNDCTWGGPEIASYDRFLPLAKILDEYNSLRSKTK